MKKAKGATASDPDRVFAEVEDFAAGAAQRDDTVMAVRYLAGPSQPMRT